MNYEKITNINNQCINNKHCAIYELWNQEYGYIYPITSELFNRNSLEIDPDVSYICTDGDQIVGFILGKLNHKKYKIANYQGFGWINLFYVLPKYRKQGIGTKLLNLALDGFKKNNCHKVYLGKDWHNYFPGLPVDLKSHLDWFINHGFLYSRNTYDLILRDLNKRQIINKKFNFKIASINDKDALIAFLNKNWPGRWTEEAIEYFDNLGNGNEYLLCLDENNLICGFAKVNNPCTKTEHISYNMTWRARFKALGGIGPLGISPAYRGQYLGYDIVNYALNHLQKFNCSDIIIDWTGLLDFYRHMGFEVWKSYFYLELNLT